MNWDELFTHTGKSDLVDVKKIYESLNLDTTKIKIISVVGTNGKGSVANYLAQGLIKNNYRVGLFTSPHLMSPNERIKINDKVITDKEVEKILARHSEFKDLVFFSTIFLVAMCHFVNNKVDVIILEAGVGGTYDSTNAVKADFGVVTSIALDHQEFLGNTTDKIAEDKAGIINPDMTFFIPTELKKEIQEIFINKVVDTENASFRMINNLSRSYSLRNKMLAKEILSLAFTINLALEDFQNLPGRTEIIDHGKYKYIYDVGHNYAGINATWKELIAKRIGVKNVVISLQKKKDKRNIKEIFKNATVYGYQLNKNYYSPAELGVKEIKDLSKFKPQANTLFIGSFHFISTLWKK